MQNKRMASLPSSPHGTYLSPRVASEPTTSTSFDSVRVALQLVPRRAQVRLALSMFASQLSKPQRSGYEQYLAED